jgi:biopolymer transport protein ExbD
MDVLKLKLTTNFMRNAIANLISKALYKKLGYDIDILLNEIEVKNEDGKVTIHIDADAEVNNGEFIKILKSIGMD